VLSQRTVGKLEVLLRQLFYRGRRVGVGYYEQKPLMSQDEYRRLLYERGTPHEVLEHIKSRYDWTPNTFLPHLYDGCIIAFVTRNDGWGDPVPNDEEAVIGQMLLWGFAEIAIQRGLEMPEHLPEVRRAAAEVVASLQLDRLAYIDGKIIEATLRGVDLQDEDDLLVHLLSIE
jgi:hypothetical protein